MYRRNIVTFNMQKQKSSQMKLNVKRESCLKSYTSVITSMFLATREGDSRYGNLRYGRVNKFGSLNRFSV